MSKSLLLAWPLLELAQFTFFGLEFRNQNRGKPEKRKKNTNTLQFELFKKCKYIHYEENNVQNVLSNELKKTLKTCTDTKEAL